MKTSAAVVVLTGASSGIGHATALELARQGATLMLAARGREGLDAVAAACERLGARTAVHETDVADADAMKKLAAATVQRFGRIDVWINNVGVGVVGLFDQTPIALHRRVIETNLIGHMNGSHVALGYFRRRERGILINMISVGGLAASPYAAAYTASKFALRGLCQALRAEMSSLPDVHVCEVYPTFVDTPGMAHGANTTGRRMKPPPPVLDARTVASRIATLIESPRASTSIGSVALPARIAHAIAPDLVGRMALRVIETALRRADAAPVTDGNLFRPSVGWSIDGGHRHPTRNFFVGAIAAAAIAAWGWKKLTSRTSS